MLILQVQLPQSHILADQLKVGRRCHCWSYGFVQGLMHNHDLFLHNLVFGFFWDVLQDRRHQQISDGSINGYPSHKLFSLKQVLGWYCVLRNFGFLPLWRCQLRGRGLILRRLDNHQPIVSLAQNIWRSEKLELVLLDCWRSTLSCIYDLVCCKNSLCYLVTVGQRSLERWLHDPHNLVFEDFISRDQWPDQEIVNVITTRVKLPQRTLDGLTEDIILSFRHQLFTPMLSHIHSLIDVCW